MPENLNRKMDAHWILLRSAFGFRMAHSENDGLPTSPISSLWIISMMIKPSADKTAGQATRRAVIRGPFVSLRPDPVLVDKNGPR